MAVKLGLKLKDIEKELADQQREELVGSLKGLVDRLNKAIADRDVWMGRRATEKKKLIEIKATLAEKLEADAFQSAEDVAAFVEEQREVMKMMAKDDGYRSYKGSKYS